MIRLLILFIIAVLITGMILVQEKGARREEIHFPFHFPKRILFVPDFSLMRWTYRELLSRSYRCWCN